MEITAILGSPRIEGNSEILLKETVRAVEEKGHRVKIFRPSIMNISPCTNCDGCLKTGICVIRDDMDIISKAIRTSDRFILASPIFFFGLTAQIKTVIDRCQSFWCEKYLLKKPVPEGPDGRKGLLLMTGGMNKEIEFTCGEATAKAFFRTINVQKHETLFYPKIDAKGAIKNHPTALKDVYEAGKRLVSKNI
ncbi:MAG: flavodoxin family protein [bacterium]|nr:flavodoxin family protein [bacterium]